MICSDSGRIIYCNDSLCKYIPGKSGAQFPKNIDEICSTDINTIASSDATDGVEANAFNKVFSIKGYKIEAQNSPYYITIWNEKTELARLNKRITDEQTVVAYVIIDNLDEFEYNINIIKELNSAPGTHSFLDRKDLRQPDIGLEFTVNQFCPQF